MQDFLESLLADMYEKNYEDVIRKVQ